ncbi:PadR family transcriptional regulator [Nocardiopsis coralliicola]
MYAQHEMSFPPFGPHGPGAQGAREAMMGPKAGYRMRGGPGGPGGPGGIRGRWGGPPWGGPGGRGPGGGRGGFGRGPRARRGDVRASALALLAEEPRNGYQLIREIERRSDGVWRPSAGSVYPALQQLQDEGLVRAAEEGGGRIFELTGEGRDAVEADPDTYAEPWNAVADGVSKSERELHQLTREVGMAVMQVSHAGTPAQQAEARRLLESTRRSLYRILAEDPPAGQDGGGAADER